MVNHWFLIGYHWFLIGYHGFSMVIMVSHWLSLVSHWLSWFLIGYHDFSCFLMVFFLFQYGIWPISTAFMEGITNFLTHPDSEYLPYLPKCGKPVEPRDKLAGMMTDESL